MGDSRVSHYFALFPLLHWLQQKSWLERKLIAVHRKSWFWSCAGGNAGIPLSLWYAKLTPGFWKENLYTHCLLLVISSSSFQHQCCLQAHSFVSFQNVQSYTLSINPKSCQHLKAFSVFFFFLFCVCFFLAHVVFRWKQGKYETCKSHN